MNVAHYQQEIEQLYSRTLAQGIRSLAICSALPQQGATTILRVLAQRNVLAGYSTLLVDLNIASPGILKVIDLPCESTLSQDHKTPLNAVIPCLSTPQLVSFADSDSVFNGIGIPQDKSSLMRLREPEVLRQLIHSWQQEYDTVLIDTTALLATGGHAVPAQQVASACDACLLVVLSGHCTQAQLVDAVECLNHQQANLVGTVMNDQYQPKLIDELKRELHRINRQLPRLVRWASGKLNGLSLLSMDI